MLLTNYRPAQLRVSILPAQFDETDEARFVRNLTTDAAFEAGNSVRDVASTQDFWVIQVFGAYEGDEDRSNDGGEDESDYGFAPGLAGATIGQGPSIVYTETVRDGAAEAAGLAEDALLNRVALHESLHRFGLLHTFPNGDSGPLDLDHNFSTDPDADLLNRLTAAQLHAVQSAVHPK